MLNKLDAVDPMNAERWAEVTQSEHDLFGLAWANVSARLRRHFPWFLGFLRSLAIRRWSDICMNCTNVLSLQPAVEDFAELHAEKSHGHMCEDTHKGRKN